ncbi:hypothetical protein LTR82_000599 [Friedmanniomyces endolithicus]|uniref:WD repeat domain-containing protein 83 n=1 Tax=Friedmanniomyces endolithicus TaxID=329885 RepID=A0AAN6JFY4_9PEZI|nr:hypothetical protein LTR82_000599 [Friedmanniomyces endolithicus]
MSRTPTASSFPTTPLTRLTPHTAPVHALAFSSGSGQYLLTGSQDRSIRLFNPTSSKLIQTYSAHGYGVLDLAVSTDNSRFASAGGDKVVFIWDVASAATVRRFQGHAGRVNAVRFAGEGDAVVVSGSFDGTARCWDLRARGERAVMVWGEARDSVSAVAVAGERVWAGSVDGRVRCYDLRAGEVEVDCLGASVTSLGVTGAGDGYLVSTLDSKVRLMDCGSGACLQKFGGEGFVNEEFRVRSTLGMGDAVAISGGENGRVFVWDVLSGEVMHRLSHKRDGEAEGAVSGNSGKRDVVSAVAWNQTRKMWASAGGDGEVVVWGKGD